MEGVKAKMQGMLVLGSDMYVVSYKSLEFFWEPLQMA